MVAQRLKENLPEFSYLKIPKRPDEWEKWLIRTCQENNWYHIQSPIIWREIGFKKGKKDFVGSINKFLDLCYDYYGIPRDVLCAGSFNKGEMQWFTNRTESEFIENVKFEARKKKAYRSRQVCITGASSSIAEILIMELLQTQKQWREDGLEIRLFDDSSKQKKLMSSATDAKYCPGPSGLGNCRVTTTLKDSLTNVDLVIVLDCLARKSKETIVKWLKRNRNAMCALGKALNKFAPPHCRVIIGSPSTQPICYNATVLASFATKLHVRNIVAVTQDLGREVLRSISTKTKVPLKDFHCPPVWGFVGLNKIVDVGNTLQSHVYKLPGKRPNSTLPQGIEEQELRTSTSFTTEDEMKDIQNRFNQSKGDSSLQLGRWPYLAKATAILDLLKIWGLKQEDGNGEIISLGVYSDGTFNIPKGLYWSQPVILINGFWVPFKDYPIPRSSYINSYYLFMYSVASLYRTKVKPRIYVPPTPVVVPKEVKKFDWNKLIQDIGMPVIRTDKECVDYLKYLAKKEFGIDFDKVDEDISEKEEEVEAMTVPVEDITKEMFCECWRQELKELQKIVFDRSSTTEVEVDISDVVSGSEWSIINPKISSFYTGSVQDQRVPSIEVLEKTSKEELVSISSESRTCSCGGLESGSICRCLVPEPKERFKNSSEDRVSTEHFYAEQNAEVFETDLKDAIYADSYLPEKHVTFDGEAKEDDLTGFQVKFYGKKDGIRDKIADTRMQKRIRRYERGGEDSVDENEGNDGIQKDSVTSLPTDKTQKDVKFHVSVQGASYEIVGDQVGLEMLDERQRGTGEGLKDSSFKEMYKDEIIPSLQILPPDLGTSTATSSGKDISLGGEEHLTFTKDKEFPREGDDDGISLGSLEKDLNEIWGEGGGDLFQEELEEEKEEEEAEKMSVPETKKRKREGVSLCCLCRCIAPEGLACCPCGATTVVEVFKKESVEVFIQSEDDITYNVQYYEKSASESTISVEFGQLEPPPPKRGLPPESFFPFTPKLDNQFKPTPRPFEFTKEYLESFKKVDLEVPPKCQELLEQARMKLEEDEEEETAEKEEEEEEEEEGEEEEEEVEELPDPCKDEEIIKTDFSDLKLFIPCSIEDWKLTVQKKYREWFFQGPQIRDESYYDIAIEEVSEDEFELDKELEQFFET